MCWYFELKVFESVVGKLAVVSLSNKPALSVVMSIAHSADTDPGEHEDIGVNGRPSCSANAKRWAGALRSPVSKCIDEHEV